MGRKTFSKISKFFREKRNSKKNSEAEDQEKQERRKYANLHVSPAASDAKPELWMPQNEELRRMMEEADAVLASVPRDAAKKFGIGSTRASMIVGRRKSPKTSEIPSLSSLINRSSESYQPAKEQSSAAQATKTRDLHMPSTSGIYAALPRSGFSVSMDSGVCSENNSSVNQVPNATEDSMCGQQNVYKNTNISGPSNLLLSEGNPGGLNFGSVLDNKESVRFYENDLENIGKSSDGANFCDANDVNNGSSGSSSEYSYEDDDDEEEEDVDNDVLNMLKSLKSGEDVPDSCNFNDFSSEENNFDVNNGGVNFNFNELAEDSDECDDNELEFGGPDFNFGDAYDEDEDSDVAYEFDGEEDDDDDGLLGRENIMKMLKSGQGLADLGDIADFGGNDDNLDDFGGNDYGMGNFGGNDDNIDDFGGNDYGMGNFGGNDDNIDDFDGNDYGMGDSGGNDDNLGDFGGNIYGMGDYGGNDDDCLYEYDDDDDEDDDDDDFGREDIEKMLRALKSGNDLPDFGNLESNGGGGGGFDFNDDNECDYDENGDASSPEMQMMNYDNGLFGQSDNLDHEDFNDGNSNDESFDLNCMNALQLGSSGDCNLHNSESLEYNPDELDDEDSSSDEGEDDEVSDYIDSARFQGQNSVDQEILSSQPEMGDASLNSHLTVIPTIAAGSQQIPSEVLGQMVPISSQSIHQAGSQTSDVVQSSSENQQKSSKKKRQITKRTKKSNKDMIIDTTIDVLSFFFV